MSCGGFFGLSEQCGPGTDEEGVVCNAGSTGKSVLNGIAIGKLKIYKKKDTAISAAEVADTAAEVARFEEAQQKAIEQQTALYEKALAEAGEDIAEVFNIHAMMLEDDDFVDAIKEIINSQKKCAEYAVKTAGNNQAAVFAAMDDPYLQARSADVIDIAQAILDILQGWTMPACRHRAQHSGRGGSGPV